MALFLTGILFFIRLYLGLQSVVLSMGVSWCTTSMEQAKRYRHSCKHKQTTNRHTNHDSSFFQEIVLLIQYYGFISMDEGI